MNIIDNDTEPFEEALGVCWIKPNTAGGGYEYLHDKDCGNYFLNHLTAVKTMLCQASVTLLLLAVRNREVEHNL